MPFSRSTKHQLPMRNLRNLAVLFLLAFTLGGCASIPLSTALRLSSLEPRSLAQVDPSQVRVKLSVSTGYEVNISKSRLKLSFTPSDTIARTADMPVALLKETTDERPGGLFSPDVQVTTYELALAPEGMRQLRALQQSLLISGQGKFKFSVSAPFSKTPPKPKNVTFWADLKLSAEEAYMPLISGAELQFKNEAGS